MEINGDRKQEMMELRISEGWTLQRIADHYDISKQRVSQILGNTGRISNRKTDKLKNAEFLIQTAHLTNGELAELLDLTERTVANFRPKKMIRELLSETA